jgi:hypothetical protein
LDRLACVVSEMTIVAAELVWAQLELIIASVSGVPAFVAG